MHWPAPSGSQSDRDEHEYSTLSKSASDVRLTSQSPTETTIHRNPIVPDRLRIVAAWTLAVMAWTGACSDEPLVTGPEDGASPFIVSDPALSVALPRGRFAVVLASVGRDSVSLAAEGATFARVAFISLPSGTVPTGTDATIRNARTGSTTTAQIVAGGLDPVGVEALESDLVELEVRRADNATPLLFVHKVPANRRPKVVRTNPPRGKRDVALNSRISIIFSEPMDSRTLAATPVQLLRGVTPVPGEVVFEDADHVTAAFIPNEPLAVGTDYRLVVNQDIYDLDGAALEEPVAAEFTTLGSASVPARLVFTVEPTTTPAGRPIAPVVQVTGQDALGSVMLGFNGIVTISLSTNPGGAVLGGTTSAEAVNGVATFPSLVLDKAGIGYRLAAGTQGVPVAAISAAFDVTALSGDVVYFNAFESAVGTEWSNTLRSVVPNVSRTGPNFLGEFGCTDYGNYGEYTARQADECHVSDLVTLTLLDLPTHDQVTISFDFYVIRSWDGNPGTDTASENICGSPSDAPQDFCAPDLFNVSVVGGPTLLNATFAVYPLRQYQSYPAQYPTDGSSPPNNPRHGGALEVGTLGYGDLGDAVYRLTFTFTHSEPTVTFKFTAPKLQPLFDESWGLDNVEVRAKPKAP